MELTRRDALGALAASGVAVGGAVAYDQVDPFADDGTDRTEAHDHDPTAVLQAVAEVVYPSELDGIDEFVDTYVAGRANDRPAYVDGVREATGTLDELSRTWYDNRVTDLDSAGRDRLLREVGADAASPDPEGTNAERIRFYVVNELLYALYSSPTGGELVGIENPQGHPGGTDSYQRGPR
jgi:hypothetical protein